MTRSLVLATALFLASAAGLSYAQPDTTTTTTTQQKTTVTTPAMPAAPAMPATAATPATPAVQPAATTPATPATPPAPGTTTTTTTTVTVPEAVTGACRTRKTVGDPCSCLKAPTTMGVSTASPTGGRNMCVIS